MRFVVGGTSTFNKPNAMLRIAIYINKPINFFHVRHSAQVLLPIVGSQCWIVLSFPLGGWNTEQFKPDVRTNKMVTSTVLVLDIFCTS